MLTALVRALRRLAARLRPVPSAAGSSYDCNGRKQPEGRTGMTAMHSAERPGDTGAGTLAIMGLGYVGLPLALAFGARRPVIGFDVSAEAVAALASGTDPRGEIGADAFAAARHLRVTSDPAALAEARTVIVAVPTPVDAARRPDFRLLARACETLAPHLARGATVVFESTVYPGATEEVCIPILEAGSGLRWKQGFHVGYSPERINPGDPVHTLGGVVKVVAGDTPETASRLARLYGEVVSAGVHVAPSIAVAEAAKVIENVQRDLNIALMNELSMICRRIGIDTQDVLAAARTKWNFLDFHPGLVGGHCIGVDPYYLTYLAERIGHHPEVILAGRRINDRMGGVVAAEVAKALIAAGVSFPGARVNVLGVTFKADVRDVRNSRVADVIAELEGFGARVAAADDLADADAFRAEYGRSLTPRADLGSCDALIVAAPHRLYREMPLADLASSLVPGGLFVDPLARFAPEAVRTAGFRHWRL